MLWLYVLLLCYRWHVARLSKDDSKYSSGERLCFEDARVTKFEFCRLYEPIAN